MARILLVDDEQSILSVLTTLLTVEGHQVLPIQDGHKAIEAINTQEFDLMVSDVRMTPVDGMELLRLAREVRPSMAVIMLTAFGSVETAVEALRMGAYDYVTKPFKIQELLLAVQWALDYRKAVSENVDLGALASGAPLFHGMVTASEGMKAVCQVIEHVAPTEAAVLIAGERGAGKSLIARAIHECSPRKAGKFIQVDCSASAGAVTDGNLFGYAKGANPSEPSGREGAFEGGAGGTVYLANIEGCGLDLQEKLFRVLQDKEITRIGGTTRAKTNVRILAGTGTNLGRLITEGRFRQDLFCRLSVISIEVKSLRERREDILPIFYHVLSQENAAKGGAPQNIVSEVRDILLNHGWPGNAEEVVAVARHALTSCSGGIIRKQDLPVPLSSLAPTQGHSIPGDEHKGKSLKAFLRFKEKEYMEKMVEQTKGDRGKAAKALKISLAALNRKLPSEEGPSEK